MLGRWKIGKIRLSAVESRNICKSMEIYLIFEGEVSDMKGEIFDMPLWPRYIGLKGKIKAQLEVIEKSYRNRERRNI